MTDPASKDRIVQKLNVICSAECWDDRWRLSMEDQLN
jgi:hypothetical protein